MAIIRDKIRSSVWPLVGCSIAFAIIYSSITFHYPFKRDIIAAPFGDLLIHFISYGLLMYCFCRSWKTQKTQILIGSGLIVLGTVLEIIQSSTVKINIQFEFGDFLANTFGVVMGYYLAKLGK